VSREATTEQEFLDKHRFSCLTGPLRSGKTWQLRKHHDHAALSLFLDLEHFPLSPELFSITLLAELRNVAPIKDKANIGFIENELEKIKPDQKAILERAFALLDIVAKEQGKELQLHLDNVERLFDLENFRGIRVMPYLSALKQTKVAGTSNYPSFCREKLKGFSFETLAHRTAGREKLAAYSEEGLVCRLHLERSLGRARGQTLLAALLPIISGQAATLTELSRKMFRSAPVTKSLLQRLMDVDLIERRDRKFYIKDPLMDRYFKEVER